MSNISIIDSDYSDSNIGIGIDLGTCNSCVSLYDGVTQKIVLDDAGNNIIPTCVLFLENEIIFGETALASSAKYSKNLIKDIKRIIGKTTLKEIEYYNKQHLYDIVEENNNISINIKHPSHTVKVTPDEIMGLYFSYLRKLINKYIAIPIDKHINAVITIPAYFTENQRIATIRAAQIAKINTIRLINEPTAATLTYLQSNEEKCCDKYSNLIIFDMGGGTLDVTLVNINSSENNLDKLVQVIGTCGNSNLGGNDFNKEIMLYFIKEIKKITPSLAVENIIQNDKIIQKILIACEKSKIELSSTNVSTICVEEIFGKDYNIVLTRTTFENLCLKYFIKCINLIEQVLNDTGTKIDEINDIVLVGGPSYMPKLKNIINDKFNIIPKILVNPKYSVSVGASIHCFNLLKKYYNLNSCSTDLLVVDVTPLKIGVSLNNNEMCTIIDKNTKIPCSSTKIFSTEIDNQRMVTIKIYQGNNILANHNELIGKLKLINIPAMKRRIPKILVKFSLDCSGTLIVSAKELVSNTIVTAVFDNKKYNLPEYDNFNNVDNILLFRSCQQKKQINDYIQSINKYLTDDMYRLTITKEKQIKLNLLKFNVMLLNFQNIEDIKKVKGIGDFVFEKIKDKIYVDEEKLPPKTESEIPPNFLTVDLPESSSESTQTKSTSPTENKTQKEISYPLDINSASVDELMTLDGIGEVLAQRIVSYREENGGFGSVEELMDVKGIGEDLFEKIKDKIFASPVTDKQTFSSADDFIKNENIGILDINKATAEEFDLLPGISPKTAVKIVNFREDIGGFSSIYELLYVDGVTESVFNKIKDYITV